MTSRDTEIERIADTEAASYMEDDPEAWAFWIDALERYVPQLPALAKHIGEEVGAFQVIGGSILAYLADRRGLYLRRSQPASEPTLDVAALARELWRAAPEKIEGGSPARRQWLADVMAVQAACHSMGQMAEFVAAMNGDPGLTQPADNEAAE